MEIKDCINKEKLKQLFELYEEDMYENAEKDDKLLQQIINKEKNFVETLTKEQQEVFDKIDEMKIKNAEETNKNVFIYAFRLAVRVIIESIA